MRNFSKIIFCVVFILSGSGCAVISKMDQPDMIKKKANYLYELGSAMLIQGKPAEAIRNLTKATEFDDTKPDYFNNLGLAFLSIDDREQGRKNFQKALELDENFGDAFINLGKMKLDEGKYNEARALFNKAAKNVKYRGNSHAYANIGLSYLKERKFKKAEWNFRRALVLNPDHCQASIWLADSYGERGAKALSLRSLVSAVGKNCPNEPFAHYKLARKYAGYSKFKKAREKYRDVIEKFPQSGFASRANEEMKKIPKR